MGLKQPCRCTEAPLAERYKTSALGNVKVLRLCHLIIRDVMIVLTLLAMMCRGVPHYRYSRCRHRLSTTLSTIFHLRSQQDWRDQHQHSPHLTRPECSPYDDRILKEVAVAKIQAHELDTLPAGETSVNEG